MARDAHRGGAVEGAGRVEAHDGRDSRLCDAHLGKVTALRVYSYYLFLPLHGNVTRNIRGNYFYRIYLLFTHEKCTHNNEHTQPHRNNEIFLHKLKIKNGFDESDDDKTIDDIEKRKGKYDKPRGFVEHTRVATLRKRH